MSNANTSGFYSRTSPILLLSPLSSNPYSARHYHQPPFHPAALTYIPCHSKGSKPWLVYYKHMCDGDWNHPVVDNAGPGTGVVEMPSTVQSITSLSFSRNHTFARLKCSFPRKPRCAERGDGCADLVMSQVSLARQMVKKWTYFNTKCFF